LDLPFPICCPWYAFNVARKAPQVSLKLLVDVFSAFPGLSNVSDLHSCLAQTSLKLSKFEIASFQILQLGFLSIALALILFKTANGKGVLAVIARQGLIYYLLNFSTETAWALMLLFATPGLKYSLAAPALGFASLSTTKLTLHFRSYGAPKEFVEECQVDEHVSFRLERRRSWVGLSTFEMSDVGREGSNVLDIGPSQRNGQTARDLPRLVRLDIGSNKKRAAVARPSWS